MHELHEISSDWVSGGLDIGWMSRFAIAVETSIPGAAALVKVPVVRASGLSLMKEETLRRVHFLHTCWHK